jgi:hypothetical protein
MLNLLVRFNRDIHEDLDCARENFPHLEFNPQLQLLEQFKFELEGNKKMRGLWTLVHSLETADRQMVWVRFEWTRSLKAFVVVLQEGFAEGMNGTWEIVDAIETGNAIRDGGIISEKDLIQACRDLT